MPLLPISWLFTSLAALTGLQSETDCEEFRDAPASAIHARLRALPLSELAQIERLAACCFQALEAAPGSVQLSRLALDLRLILAEASFEAQDYHAAIVHFDRAAALARAQANPAALTQAVGNLGLAAFHVGEFERAEVSLEEALQAAREQEDPGAIARLANTLGAVHLRRANYEQALAAYDEALSVLPDFEDALVANTLNNIGVAQLYQGQHDVAEESFQEVLALFTQLGNRVGRASALSNLGDVLHLTRRSAEALPLHVEALALREELGQEEGLIPSLKGLGAVLVALGRPAEALEQVQRALIIIERLDLRPERAATLGIQAEALALLDRDDEALDAATAGLALAEELDLKGRRIGAHDSLANVLALNGEPEQALVHLVLARDLERDLRSLQDQKALMAFRAQFEALERERRIGLLEKENQVQALSLDNQRLTRDSLLVGGGLFALLALVGWSRYLVRRRANAVLDLSLRDLREANRREIERGLELEDALGRIRRLEGLLPICGYCKSIRDAAGSWKQLEDYLVAHAEVDLSHGICPRCYDKHVPEFSTSTAGT